MNERRRPHRRGRGPRPFGNAPADSQADATSEPNPYRDGGDTDSTPVADSHPPQDRTPAPADSPSPDRPAVTEQYSDRRSEPAALGNDPGPGASRSPTTMRLPSPAAVRGDSPTTCRRHATEAKGAARATTRRTGRARRAATTAVITTTAAASTALTAATAGATAVAATRTGITNKPRHITDRRFQS